MVALRGYCVRIVSIVIIGLLFSKEGYVSQVFIEEQTTPFDELVLNPHIVWVQDLKRSEVYKEVNFPKETHYLKSEENVYQEYIQFYKVEKVLASSKIKVGDIIKVWQQPSYGLDVIKTYHEIGMLESPIEWRHTPHFEHDNEHFFLFLQEHDTVYADSGAKEGADAEPMILEYLKKSLNSGGVIEPEF